MVLYNIINNFSTGEEENLSEIDSDDVIEDVEDNANSSVTKSKKNVNKRAKRKGGSKKKLKKM